MSASIHVAGMEELGRALRALGSAEAAERVARLGGEQLRTMAELNFRSPRMRPAKWPALKDSTLKRKKGTRPLVDTGTLMRSLEVRGASASGVEVASTQDYANYHQYGTKKMPARPFFPITGEYGGDATPTPEAEKRILRTMKRALADEARRNGFATSD